MATPGAQRPLKQPKTSNRFSHVPAVGLSTQELCETIHSTRSATLTLLKDTKWPRESNDAAQNLLQIVDTIPDLTTEVLPAEDDVEQFVQVLEVVHTKVKGASEKYGMRERGFRDKIKHYMSSLHDSKCTEILRTCWEDIERVLTMLRNCLDSVKVTAGSRDGSETPAGPHAQANVSPINSESPVELPERPLGPAAKPEDPISRQASVPDPSEDVLQGRESRNPIRDGVLTAARKTFQTVELVSSAIPGVGDFVGVAAKVGLAFVNMIETMDKNEDVSRELAHHTSKLSAYLDHFKKKSDPENGDELVTYIDSIHKELEDVRGKVNQWSRSGRLKKAFLSGDHAGDLKGYQDTVQTALEEMQLLVSLKTSDLVVELKNAELQAERRRLLTCLGDGSYGARGNSIEDVVCLTGTRVEILERIDEWIKDPSDSAERVLWIRGMAGRGKSTIASTVAHNWASKGSSAIFHFRRGQNALDGQFVCALARQLGKGLVPEVKNAILGCVKENEDIAKERLDQQFKTLLVGSLGKLQDHEHPIIIVVDALDECKNVADTVRFVRLIDQHSSFLPANVKFLLTCRPEAPLLIALEPRKWRVEDLDLTSTTSEDIARFIQNACAQIRKDHDLPETWPSSSDLKLIVEMSQGLFQWARTAIAYIGDRSPRHRLQELLRRSSTWGGLDDLYHQILTKAFKEVETDSMREQLLSWILGTLVVAPYPVSPEVIAFLYADHPVFEGQNDIVQFLRGDILADLNSLLHVPTSLSQPMRLMHTSIRDLLMAQARCGHQRYFIDTTEGHRRLSGITLGIMGRSLKQNICNLPHILMANSEIHHVVDDHVSEGLRYCCRSWSIHLIAGISGPETTAEGAKPILEKFGVFSEEKLLFWLEVMSLIGASIEASLVAKQVYDWLLEWPDEMSNGLLISLWSDIRRFIAAFIEAISFGALHIYASALPQCPAGTKLWAKYGNQATTRILLGNRRLDWRKNIWTSSTGGGMVEAVTFSPDGSTIASASSSGVHLWDAQIGVCLARVSIEFLSSVWSVAFSPDGKVLAYGSKDNTVRLWDSQTGAPLGDPLTGHNSTIFSVSFSPDGKILASGSGDKTIRLWDARTGEPIGGPLTGCEKWVRRVVFAPDSKILASGSEENTIRLWDTQTGALSCDPLTGHEASTMAFSPDGNTLACGSLDRTVRLWHPRTGTSLVDPLTGHKSPISSVAFSPDSKVLASGSGDGTIRLWDAQTGVPLGHPLIGHKYSVGTVLFSPDGKVLASRLSGGTIQLWHARTGAPMGTPLTGHGGRITSLAFSPDSKLLASGSHDYTVRVWDARIEAPLEHSQTGLDRGISDLNSSSASQALTSGSYDKTVRLWDGQTGAPLSEPLTGHSSHIETVEFSPDGKVLASCSTDKTVRLWDAQTGAPLGDPLTGHNDWHDRIAFSPDGRVLVSRLDDKKVRLWDVQTGSPLSDPLTGHNNWIGHVTFSPDGKVLVSSSGAFTVQFWDAQTGAPLGVPPGFRDNWIDYSIFSPDNKFLVSMSDRGQARLWDVRAGVPLGDPLEGHTGEIRSVVFAPDGKVLASGSKDGTVRLRDPQTGAPLGDPLTGYNGWRNSIAFSPNGKVLAFGSGDKAIRLWDAETGAPMGDPLIGHSERVDCLAFSSDGRLLASGSRDKTVRLWDAHTGAPLGDPLTGPISSIDSVRFSPDGHVVASKSFWHSPKCRFQLWCTRTGARLDDPRLIDNSHGSALRWDPLPRQLHDFPNKFTLERLKFESGWLIWNSKRLMWLPAQDWGQDVIGKMFSFQRLAIRSNKSLSILDVSRSLKL